MENVNDLEAGQRQSRTKTTNLLLRLGGNRIHWWLKARVRKN